MPKYEVLAREWVYYSIQVEAENEDHAKEIARDIRADEHIQYVDYFEIDSVEEMENA